MLLIYQLILIHNLLTNCILLSQFHTKYYFGLLFLIAGYTAVGIFTSTLSENQIVAFIVSVFLCFLLYFGFQGVASQFKEFEDVIAFFGMDYHFKSMSRGVLDTRDILYFVSYRFVLIATRGYLPYLGYGDLLLKLIYYCL